MKEVTDKLIREHYNRRKEDNMCLCEKIHHWWKNEIWQFRMLLLNMFVAGAMGGVVVAIIFITIYCMWR